jgi:glyoxylase-like metal-dependent hydrolase (beta-lactamase superfamily II)
MRSELTAQVLCVALCWPLLQASSASAQPMPKREVVEIADGIFAATGYASNNMGFVITDAGVVVIDTGMTPELGQAFLEDIRRHTDQPVRYVIFTHYHYDHVDGASAFRSPRVEFVAQENLVWNLKNLKGLEHVNQQVLGEVSEAPVVYPDITYAETRTLTLGNREIRLYHAMGETSDATLVFVPDEGVMFIGDLNNANLGAPVMPEGYPEGFVVAVDLIESLAPRILVPGHGRIEDTTLASLQAMREVTVWLMARVRELVGEGLNLEETHAAVSMPPEFAADPLLARMFAACRETYVNRLFKNYTGYYGRNPVTFRPAPAARRSSLLAELAGGNQRLVARAKSLADDGEHQLALELLDIVVTNEPDNDTALQLMADVYAGLASGDRNLTWYHRVAYLNAARKARAMAEQAR